MYSLPKKSIMTENISEGCDFEKGGFFSLESSNLAKMFKKYKLCFSHFLKIDLNIV